MKIGINNIFTSFWLILMICCGITFYYWAFCMNFFASDVPILGKFFVGLLMLITFAVFVFFIIYFRILIIKNNEIISIYPFRLKFKKISVDNIKNILWDSIIIKASLYKKITISTSDGNSTYLSDLEFENFDSLISKIPNINTNKLKNFEKYQAENHDPKFTLICIIILNLLILYLNLFADIFHWVHIVLYIVSLFLIIGTVRRIKKYNNIKKNCR